jgi:phospholipid transport system substrate-binding protein
MQGMMQGMLIGLLSFVWLSGPRPAESSTPTEFIRQTTDSILQIFADPRLQGPEHREARLAHLRHIMNTAFDWEEIARRTLATHWRERTPQERQEFPGLFRDAVQAMYLERLEQTARQWLPERQAIAYGEEVVDGTRAVVRTTIATKHLRQIPIEYRLRQSGGQWRVYDVVVIGVSLVNNYRVQFHRIITQSSYQGLVQQLQVRQLGEVFTEPPQPPR